MKNKKIKKLLTLDDLVSFCESNNLFAFNSKDTGYQLAVQIPATFEQDNSDDNSLLFAIVKCFHTGKNRNKSNVTVEAAKKSLSTIKYKPILAHIFSYEENGEIIEDFAGHTMEIVDGKTVYIEKQIGCFTADEPWMEVDDKDSTKQYVYARAAIPREYTSAADIIERKGGTKVSVELAVNELEYSVKEKTLILSDIEVQGLTLLGKDMYTLKDIDEGMINSRLDIEDFSAKNNSIFSTMSDEAASVNQKLIDTLEKINTTLSNFNKEENQKGGNLVTKFEELLEKYNVTKEQIDFDYENISDEELEQKFAELFDEAADDEGTEPSNDSEPEEPVSDKEPEVNNENVSDDTENDSEVLEIESQPVTALKPEDNTVVEQKACGSKKKKKKCSIESENGDVVSFEISLDEKIWALNDLVNATYSEYDNCWYSTKVYDNYIIMIDYWTGVSYKQSYKADGDNFSLTGDRIEVYVTYLTQEELDSVTEMRSNYSTLVKYKENIEFEKLHAERENILNNKKYSILSEVEKFNELVENMDNYSLVDLEKEVKIIFADYVSTLGEFSLKGNNSYKGKRVGIDASYSKSDEESPYGDYFKSLEN